MAEKSIRRLGVKILNSKNDYFSIKKEDKEAIKEIINYYNAIEQSTLESNELLMKFMYYTLMRAIEKNRDKKLKEIIEMISKEIMFSESSLLLEFLDNEIELVRWLKVCEKVGINMSDINADDTDKLKQHQKKLIEVVKNPYTSDEAFKLVQSWYVDLILKHEAIKSGVHPSQFKKSETEKLHKNFSTFGK